ncbi:glycosyltransferase [Pullulanibacillus sp. KACC 23026]|uniref:glycosyltransferase n=1 Tax=Pullulanibacillus sp. KACC 23026 TaxID=3028315 RepID=UPI0023B00141|nr:glycosyltransferase [Pullulanibacillus sp. KACC 23026]WEG11501.1 glycosyltransferase [Pullulanibacillus sp. KACC 23026]
MRQRVLFMLSSMRIGGVEKAFTSLLSEIPRNRYDVTVMLLEKRGELLNLIPEWVHVVEAPWYKTIKPIIMGTPQQTIQLYRSKRRYARILSFIGYYLVSKHANDRLAYYNYVMRDIEKEQDKYDIAVAYQGPTDIIDFYIAYKVEAARKLSWVHFDVNHHVINKRLYNKMYQEFDQLVAVSSAAKKSLVQLIPSVRNKVIVVENILSEKAIKEMAKASIQFDPGFEGIKIVTVGRLSKEKGQDLLIPVLKKLQEEGYNARWYCVGEGKARIEYESLIESYQLSDDFILLGSTLNPYPYIAEADIYVQPSRHDSFCLTLAEAKLLKKPIVATNFIGAYEQLVDGYNGFIVNNEKELFNRLKQLIDNKELRKKLINNL